MGAWYHDFLSFIEAGSWVLCSYQQLFLQVKLAGLGDVGVGTCLSEHLPGYCEFLIVILNFPCFSSQGSVKPSPKVPCILFVACPHLLEGASSVSHIRVYLGLQLLRQDSSVGDGTLEAHTLD